MNDLFIKKETMLEILASIGFSDSVIKNANYKISLYINYLSANKLNPSIKSIENFIDYYSKSLKEFTDYNRKKTRRECVRFLNFLENGNVINNPVVRVYEISGKYGIKFESFIDYLRKNKYLSLSTLEYYHSIMRELDLFLTKKDLVLCEKTIISYFEYLRNENRTQHSMYKRKSIIKMYLIYLSERGENTDKLMKSLPYIRYPRTKELPSFYTEAEIKRIIATIDRNSTFGKRNYAMTLLAVRYGLRASDVTGLKFDNINWEKNIIILNQQKTKNTVDFPLIPSVGNAIIDYLKNGRRKCKSDNIFVTDKGQIKGITSASLYNTIRAAINKAGIETMGRKQGPHCLRNSLATKLLEENAPLPIISAALGHSNTQVTTVYLSIDINSLRNCPIDMPTLKSKIYEEAI